MLEQRIQQQFFDGADLQYQAAESLARPIADAAQALLGALTAGAKIMAGGSGAGRWLAQHLATTLVGRFERERPALAALALQVDAGALDKQLQALGQPGDVLVLFDTDGADAALPAALLAAHDKDMSVVVLAAQAS
ncbi:MAG: SIS domain-containing protein, partial [Rubrivivax sp.]|nr:SIS domain-containing protein [Rubrivivax sp.]